MGLARRWVGVGALCLLLLTGCADKPAAAAAEVGQQRLTLNEVSDQLHDINEVLGAPASAVDTQLTNSVVRNNVVHQLIEQAAAAAGVQVSQAEIQKRLAAQVEFVGSREALERQAALLGLAPDMIEAEARATLLVQDLKQELTAGTNLDEQSQDQVAVAAIQQYSRQIGVLVNPRFGVWDVDSLSIVVDPDAPSASPNLGLTGLPDAG